MFSSEAVPAAPQGLVPATRAGPLRAPRLPSRPQAPAAEGVFCDPTFHRPAAPPRHSALAGPAPLSSGWQEGPLTEGSGPSASSVARPVLVEDPRPRATLCDGGRPGGPGEGGLPAARPAGLLLQGLALQTAGALGLQEKGVRTSPAPGCGCSFPRSASTHLSLPPSLPSFPLCFLTGRHCHPALWVSSAPSLQRAGHSLPQRGTRLAFLCLQEPWTTQSPLSEESVFLARTYSRKLFRFFLNYLHIYIYKMCILYMTSPSQFLRK